MPEPFRLQYRTTTRVERVGPWGALSRWVARHPMRAGLLCGLAAIAVAALRAPAGVAKEPALAAILAGLVLAVWVVLMRAMRGFFASQTTEALEVVRVLELSAQELRWGQLGRSPLTLHKPRFALYALEAVPDGQERAAASRAWPALIVATDDQGQRFALETRVTAQEAQALPPCPEVIPADELLPAHVASALLERARGQAPSPEEPPRA